MWNHIFKLMWNKKATHIGMIIEIFGTFVVLLGVVLFLSYYWTNLNRPIGFETRDRWMVNLEQTLTDMDSIEQVQLLDILKHELVAMDSVEGASMIDFIQPYRGSMSSRSGHWDEVPFYAYTASVDIDFKDVVGLEMTDGEWFDRDLQHQRNPAQIIINQQLVDNYSQGAQMIGEILSLDLEREVSGIMSDYKYNGDFVTSEPQVLTLMPHTDPYTSAVILKMSPDVSPGYQAVLHKELKALIPNRPFEINALDDMRTSANRSTWVIIVAVISISLFLLINVAMGLFGVLIYNIKKRQPEIALRMALGADSSFIYRQLLGEMLVLGLLGIIPGILLCIQIYWLGLLPGELQSGFLQSMGFTLMILVFIILVCSLLPAWQATRLQAAEVLKEE